LADQKKKVPLNLKVLRHTQQGLQSKNPRTC